MPIALILLILALLAPPARAADLSSATMPVRTTEEAMAEIISAAMAGSPSFRLLVERLAASDVVVYVRSQRNLPSGVDGYLSFMGSAGGRRYVVVTLSWGKPKLRLVATLGHELQHAVEIAEHNQIVDHTSLGEAYEGFGSEGAWRPKGRSFDTQAAIDAGTRIWKEMQRGVK